jgi:hypothetical protein
VDRGRLTRVRDEVGEGTMRRFVAAYLEVLPPRLQHIAHPRESGRADGLRAAFDLRVGSEMLGAARLAELAAGIERSFEGGAEPGARQLTQLRGEADAVARTLSGLLGDDDSAGESGSDEGDGR